ncbi:apolipoprotein D-like [Diorhabda sublineata]|uniref:apolipoprotein D-like n=1 Tax=Diorhabda sublineata TaxID=1163346 RepID=UPI0024E0746D|nr:apolipoprotein D-like [Diorhabda sublineata]
MLVKLHSTIVIVFCFSQLKWTTGFGLGPCPKIENTRTINTTKLTGHWFEIERSFYLMELISTCVTLDLNENARGRFDVSVNTRSAWTGIFSISEGIAIPTKVDPTLYLYKVNSRLPRLINRYLPGTGFYKVLKTDYNNYLVVYSCTNYQIIHLDMIWIWGRKNEIDAELRSDLYALLNKYDIDTERLILSKSNNCTDEYYDDLDYYY